MKKICSPCKSDAVPNGWHAEWQTLEITSEELHNLFDDLKKSLPKCIYSNKVADKNERLKKIPEYSVASIFNESVNKYKDSALKPKFFEIIKQIGEEMTTVATAQRDLDIKLEELVEKLEVSDYATIQKKRKELADCSAELKSGKKTEDQVTKQRQDTLKVLFAFASQCREYTLKMLECLKLQSNFYKQCAESLSKKIPEIESNINACMPIKPYFQTPMLEHLRHTGRDVPYVMQVCIEALRQKTEWKVERVFSTSGAISEVNTLMKALDSNGKAFIEEADWRSVATAFKKYLSMNPLIPQEHETEWIEAQKKSTDANRFELLKAVLEKMPNENKRTLGFLVHILHEVVSQAAVNKMDSKNVSIVFAGTVFPSSNDPNDVKEQIPLRAHSLQFLIENEQKLFPK